MEETIFSLARTNPNNSALIVPQEEGGSEDDHYFGSIGDATRITHTIHVSHYFEIIFTVCGSTKKQWSSSIIPSYLVVLKADVAITA
jgi:hypothetical protein